MLQNLYKNWLLVSKIISGIWITSDKQWKVKKKWNSMGCICLKTTFLQLKRIPKIYTTLIHQISYVIFETISHFSRQTHLHYFSPNTTYFWQKYPIKVQIFKFSTAGVIFHDTEEGYKIWRGIDLLFQNWHKEFLQILTWAL